jgi:hypothetical protein
VWWTVFGDESRPTPLRDRLSGLYQRYLPHERRPAPTGPLNIDSWCDEISGGGWFSRPLVTQIRWTQHMDAQTAQRLFASFPNVNELEPRHREEFLDCVGDAVQDLGGWVDDPRVTVIYLARPLSGRPEQV